AAGFGPAVHLSSAALVIIAFVAAISALLVDLRERSTRESSGRLRRPSLAVLILSGIGFCIFLSEGAIADWTSVYLVEILHARESIAAAGYAVFSGAMTVFRLAGDAITARLGRG